MSLLFYATIIVTSNKTAKLLKGATIPIPPHIQDEHDNSLLWKII